MAAAIRYAVDRHKPVLMIGQPRLSYENSLERHASQQRAVAEMIARDFAGNDRVRYVDMGNAVSTNDGSLAFDGMHLNAKGNAIVAAALAPAVREMLARR